MTKDITDIPSFYVSLQNEYAFYRPLSRETFNLLMLRTFKLNPLPFHVINYLLIIFNSILCFTLVKKISGEKILAIFSSLLFSLSAIHSIELYYLASVQTLLSTFFLLLSLYFYTYLLIKKNIKIYLLSILFYIFALLSHETAIVLSGILFVLTIFFKINKKFSIKNIYYLIPFIFITVIYLFSTGLFNHLPSQKVYAPIFSLKSIINTLSWYILWSFGLSEIIIDYVGPKFQINSNLLKWYSDYIQIVISSFVMLVLSIIYYVYAYKRKLLNNIYFLLVIAFAYILSLSPFLFFPQHKSSYYMSFSTIWFSIFIAIILNIVWQNQKLAKIWVMIWIFLFAIISFQTSSLDKLTYWAAKRSVAAEYLLKNIKKTYPTLQNNAVFYIKNDPKYPFIAKEWGGSSKQAFYILSGADALKLTYNNPNLKVFFEDMDKLPANINQFQIVSYTAKFPY